MKKKMIEFVKNTFFTTGLTLTLLACFAFSVGGCAIYVTTIFEALLTNICIQFTYLLTKKIETPYFILDMLIDVLAIVFVVLLFGKMFHWFLSTPVWCLIVMSILTYIVCFVFQIVRVKNDVHFINEKLRQKRH